MKPENMAFLRCTNFIELLKYEQKSNSMEKVVNKNVAMQAKGKIPTMCI